MRLEKNAYGEDFPLEIRILNIEKYPSHYHADIEIIYVLEGELNYRNGPFDYVLKPGDIFTNNSREVHSMYSNGKRNKVAMIKISSQFFTRFFPKLSQSTYMFYSDKEKVPQQEHLRNRILNLLDKYLKQGFNYKNQCIDEALHIIEYLNTHFNVFAFNMNQLKKFESTNPVIIKRLHNIIHYIYENHSSDISLQDLAEMEHLNTYYLSHMIKDTMGISFVQFLYFVRVEWSEVNLLNPNKKISTIAKEVGFSSTSLYRKYFRYWFHCDPEVYREKYIPLIKSSVNPEIVYPYDISDSLETIQSLMHYANAYDISGNNMCTESINIKLTPYTPVVKTINYKLKIIVTLEDYKILQSKLISILDELKCKDIEIHVTPSDNAIEILDFCKTLQRNGHPSSIVNQYRSFPKAYGFNSIISLIYILHHCERFNHENLAIHLREQGEPDIPIKGELALLNSQGICMPAYYACKILSNMSGDILAYGRNHYIMRLHSEELTYMLITFNCSDSLERLCKTRATLYEIKSAIHSFENKLEIKTSIILPAGKYLMSKYTFDDSNNFFNFLAKMNFPSKLPTVHSQELVYCTTPQTDVFITQMTEDLTITNIFSGIGVQINLLQKL